LAAPTAVVRPAKVRASAASRRGRNFGTSTGGLRAAGMRLRRRRVDYNLEEEEDIQHSADEVMVSRKATLRFSSSGVATASKKTPARVAADKKGKEAASAAGKKKTPIPSGKRAKGSSSTKARKKVTSHCNQDS